MGVMDHFAVLNISKVHYEAAVHIYLNTNHPCHLTCFLTEIKPQRHKDSRILRGLAIPWGAYFCFIGWHPVEQTEPGDTLIHTFFIPNWSYCQTVYFLFKGTVDATPSPSISAIFTQHHPGADTHLFEHYITGDDNDTGAQGYEHQWFGQTFTPSIAHTVNSIKLLLLRVGFPGTVVVSIRNTTAGEPSGFDLTGGATNGNTLPPGAPYEWREITFSAGTPLLAGTKYAIVVRSASPTYANRVKCRLDASAPTYAGGQYVTSGDYGVTWTRNPPDLMFEEWYIK